MRTISESFKIISDKIKELTYPVLKYLANPANDVKVKKWEDNFKFQFNDELKELYSLANGTLNDKNVPSGLLGLIPIHVFLSLEDAYNYYKETIDYPDLFTNWDTEIKPGKKLFPLLEDGAGNCYWIDLNPDTENYGKVYWTNTFGESPDYTFESLSNFFQVISESYEKGIMFLDDEGYLDCDYEAFDDLSAQYNSELEYWLDEEE